MALRAQLGGAFFGDAPLMWSVAGGACISQSFNMNGMLAAFHGSLVALRAGGSGFFFGIVDLVAVVAFERLMRSRRARWLCQRRFILMACDALFIARYQWPVAEAVAVGANQRLHFRKHVVCMRMTIDADLLFRFRLVSLEGMAGGALDTFFEPVQ